MFPVNNSNSFLEKNILSLAKAKKMVNDLKKTGKKVGLCHGGFDLMHPGHVKHFQSAKDLCDFLIVSVSSDQFVSKRKGLGRPIFSDKLRAYMISMIKSVDFVLISNYSSAIEVIEALKPTYYIKGPDYKNKNTPGIMAEKEAIKKVGGTIKYTNDEKLGTTDLIEYIKNLLDKPSLLIGVDRDGTLIEKRDFLGKEKNWKKEIKIKNELIDLLYYLQKKYITTTIVVTNQGGVARKYFDEKKIEQINTYVNRLCSEKGIHIDAWEFCPDVDCEYATLHSNKICFDPKYVKSKTKRKPSPIMLLDALKKISKSLDDFSATIIIGDSEDDRLLAKNLNAYFVDALNCDYKQAVSGIEAYLRRVI